jgi:Zn-dependent M28 family amino/carboxypeptidase
MARRTSVQGNAVGRLKVKLAVGSALAGLALGSAAMAQGPTPAGGPVSPAEMSATVKVLASDAFEGRAPGTPGEVKTVDYLVQRFKALGLQPGGANGAWTQAVPLVRTQVEAPELGFHDAKGALAMRQGEEIYVSTTRPVAQIDIKDAPLVFVGYGVHAPERGWDDFKGVDLKGKVAVFLVNDPDFEAQPGEPAAGKFGGKAMTYYGRWTYKYEEAARRGAIGALIVHDTPGAGYGWSTVTAPGGEAYAVAQGPDAAQPVLLQGWLRGDAAAELFKREGLDLDALRVKARSPDFHPVALDGLRFDAAAKVGVTHVESHNVLAKLTGTTHPGETVMFGAHWDAYGIGKPDASGDRIRHGANDDGLGVAGVLEIARAFSHAPRPQRTVVFAIWTGEERGLLGSEAYAEHPLYPLAKTAGNLTLDVLETAGPSHDVVLIGGGQDSLERDFARAAAKQGRTVTPDAHPEKGLFYRADHFSVAKRGVPTLLLMALGGGPDLVKGGREAGDKWVNDYTAHCYHQPCDNWSPDWDLRGAAQDVDLIYDVGAHLANSREWPSWNAGSEFKAVREQSAAERK